MSLTECVAAISHVNELSFYGVALSGEQSQVPAMPRFFFDITTDDRIDRDLEGTDLPDVAAARAEATQCFGEMIRGSSAGEPPERWSMDVRDEMGQPTLKASFQMMSLRP